MESPLTWTRGSTTSIFLFSCFLSLWAWTRSGLLCSPLLDTITAPLLWEYASSEQKTPKRAEPQGQQSQRLLSIRTAALWRAFRTLQHSAMWFLVTHSEAVFKQMTQLSICLYSKDQQPVSSWLVLYVHTRQEQMQQRQKNWRVTATETQLFFLHPSPQL